MPLGSSKLVQFPWIQLGVKDTGYQSGLNLHEKLAQGDSTSNLENPDQIGLVGISAIWNDCKRNTSREMVVISSWRGVWVKRVWV